MRASHPHLLHCLGLTCKAAAEAGEAGDVGSAGGPASEVEAGGLASRYRELRAGQCCAIASSACDANA